MLYQQPGSISSLLVWKPALPPKCKSLMEIQQEQAKHQRVEEQGVAEVVPCTILLEDSVVNSGTLVHGSISLPPSSEFFKRNTGRGGLQSIECGYFTRACDVLSCNYVCE